MQLQPLCDWLRARGGIRRGLCLLAAVLCLDGAGAEERSLRLGVTTTTENSGLISYLIPVFEAATHYSVRVITAGSGRTLRLLANGDIDVALTHAPQLEAELVRSGQAINYQPVMYNEFVLVGPERDPARAANGPTIVAALQAIAASEWGFISRGDESGTHLRELELWRLAKIAPSAEWYREAGQGMGKTLHIAAELDSYTLVDRATWLLYADKLPLRLITQGSEQLLNRYGVLSANPSLQDDNNAAGARAFTRWITSPDGMRLIRDFSVNGQQVFVPVL